MGRIDDFRNMLKEKRLGFKLDEIMSGEHSFEPGFGTPGSHPMKFEVTWGPKDLGQWINPFADSFFKQELAGTVSIGGLCDKASCQGALELNYFSERKIRYTFEFEAKGKGYRYVGEKVNIRPWNLPVSHTTCFGRVTEKKTGRLVSTSVTYFRLYTTPLFIASMRLA
jgi:hypothetical protein